jgi:hypothetical protein
MPGAGEYLGEGNKLDRVLGGLRALRDGGVDAAGRTPLRPDHEKLRAVASSLASRLVAGNDVDAEAVAEAMEDPGGSVAETAALTEKHDRQQRSSFLRSAPEAPSDDMSAADRSKVMVVHGQDAAAARAMFDWLRAIGLRPQEWSHLVSSSGEASPFIGRVLENAFSEAQAVVVLFRPDEHVRVRDEFTQGAARVASPGPAQRPVRSRDGVCRLFVAQRPRRPRRPGASE